MAKDFSTKCEVLAQLSIDQQYLNRIPSELEELVRVEEVVLTLAWLLVMKYAEPNLKSIELIEEVYSQYEEIYANGI